MHQCIEWLTRYYVIIVGTFCAVILVVPALFILLFWMFKSLTPKEMPVMNEEIESIKKSSPIEVLLRYSVIVLVISTSTLVLAWSMVPTCPVCVDVFAPPQVTSRTHLHRIGTAFRYYQNVHESLPTWAIFDSRGKPLLSWRVAILPYLGGCGELYEKFKLDEPWDSPNNKPLLSQIPVVFRPPSKGPMPIVARPPSSELRDEFKTHYRVFVGKDTLFEGMERLSSLDMGDGSHYTILAIETDEAVFWTKPDEVEYFPEKPLPKLGGLYSDWKGLNILFGDGSIYSQELPFDEMNIRAGILRNDRKMFCFPR